MTGTLNDFQTIEFRGRFENFPIPIFDPRFKDKNTTMIMGIINDSGEHKVKPVIVVKEMELITNPKGSWPTKAVQEIFLASKNQDDEEKYSKEIIEKFLARAFRRTVSDIEVQQYHKLWKELRPLSRSFKESIKDTLSAVLCSPHFLYLIEVNANSDKLEVSEQELANRMSFFLWNTMPDSLLKKKAINKQLRTNLKDEVLRMLNDTRTSDFITNFTSEWLRFIK